MLSEEELLVLLKKYGEKTHICPETVRTYILQQVTIICEEEKQQENIQSEEME